MVRGLLLAGMALASVGKASAKPAVPPPPPLAVPTHVFDRGVLLPPSVPQGKLPDVVTPLAYRLDLTVDPAKPGFAGHVEIDSRLSDATAYVYLHGRDLAVTRAIARIGQQEFSAQWRQIDETGVALLTFDRVLPAGPVTFEFDYNAPFQDGPAGLFRVHVGDDWYVWSQFESIDARSAYPSFDQPGYKQPFTVTLRTPPGLTAVSNAPQTGVSREGGLDVHRFAPTPPLPSYLVALMVGPFACVAGEAPASAERKAPLPMRIVSTRQNAAKLGFALENSKRIVALLEDYFGDAFPYPKLDQITSPIMPGAMENAGADLYQDNLIVMDETATPAQKRGFGMVVGHELAHQWFGDLVTPAWWDDIWLNESFANWMGYRIGNLWRPDLKIGAGALAEGFAAMGTDALVAGRPIHQPIEKNAQIDAAFDSITYGKGGHVVAMIAAFMGDERFRAGVRAYMAAHRYGNATSAEFFKAMADVSGDPRILPAMQGFTDQQGVPLLTFAGKGGAWTVTQSRYARLGATPPETRWMVPMCLRRGAARQCSLLDGASAAVRIGGSGPLVPNAGGTGYYRFELPPAEWDRLIAASASLPGGEALALADSLRASFQAGRAGADKLVALAARMSANPDGYAAEAALDGVQALDGWGMLDDRATKAVHGFVGRLLKPELARLGFDPAMGAVAGEAPERTQRRLQVVRELAGFAEDGAVRARLAGAANAWLAGDAKALDPAWYGAAFEAVLKAGGLPVARTLYERALATQDPLLRPAILGALARSGKADVAGWLLADAADKRLRVSERMGMIGGIAATKETRELGYGYMRDNVDSLLSGGAGIFFASRLPQYFGGFCSVDKAEAISRDFGAKLAGKTSELELARTIERVRACGVLKNARAAEASAVIAKLR